MVTLNNFTSTSTSPTPTSTSTSTSTKILHDIYNDADYLLDL